MKTALITGGLRGIGRGISEALIGENYSLAICGTRHINETGNALSELQSLTKGQQKVLYYTCDVGEKADRQMLLASLRKDFEYLDVLVNNAGVAPKERSDILSLTEENYEWLMNVNLQGPFFLTQQIARWMLESKEKYPEVHSRIINVSSISASTVSVNRAEYCISKAGISMATKLWAVRLAEFGIPVYEIRPGIIRSDMTANVSEKYTKLIEEGIVPEKRWGYPEDIGQAVAMLARGDLVYSTGQVLTIDGGLNIPRL